MSEQDQKPWIENKQDFHFQFWTQRIQTTKCAKGWRNHGEVTPLSSRTPRARQRNLFFLCCITKMDQNFIIF